MSTVNKVILVGNVGRDPEIWRSENAANAKFSLATSERWKDRSSGERREKTDWHQVVVWGEGLVGIVEKYVAKGSKIYIEGKLETRKWQDESGQDRYTTQVVVKPIRGKLVLLGPGQGTDHNQHPGTNSDPGSRGQSYEDAKNGTGPSGSAGYDDPMQDPVPFAPEYR